MKLSEIVRVHQLHEPFFENSYKGVTVISFDLGLFDLLFKLFEWLVVSRFGLQKEFQNLLDLLRLKLLVNRIKIFRFILPESDFN